LAERHKLRANFPAARLQAEGASGNWNQAQPKRASHGGSGRPWLRERGTTATLGYLGTFEAILRAARA